MRCYLVILLSCQLVCLTAQDREEVPLLNETVWVKRLGKSALSIHLEEGDSLVFDVKVSKARKIKSYTIYDVNGGVLGKKEKVSRIVGDSYIVNAKGEHVLEFKNKGINPREIALSVNRYPKPPTYIYRDTILWDTIEVMKKIVELHYDTIPKKLLVESVRLAPNISLDKKSRAVLELPLKMAPRYYWVTWLGVGNDALEDYQKFEQSPPLDWELKNVDNPMIAYGLSLCDQLPIGNQIHSINAFYADKNDAQIFMRGGSALRFDHKGKRGLIPLSSRSESSDFVELYPLYLCLDNLENISPVTIHIKVVGFEIIERREEKEIPVMKVEKKVETLKIEQK